MSNKQQATPAASVASVPATDASLNDLHALTLQWAHDRNLIFGSTFLAQYCKLLEEFGEVAAGVNKGKPELVADGLGDMLVVLTILQEQARLAHPEPLHGEGPLVQATVYAMVHCQELNASEDAERRGLVYMAYCLGHADSIRHDLIYMPAGCVRLDVLHTMAKLAYLNGTTLAECWAMAYDAIKDRKGRMENGVFIKEEDLQRAEPQAEPCVSVYAVPAGDLT